MNVKWYIIHMTQILKRNNIAPRCEKQCISGGVTIVHWYMVKAVCASLQLENCT